MGKTTGVAASGFLLGLLAIAPSFAADEPVEYGVDVSFPIHRHEISTNYPWLSHNVDSEHVPTPEDFEDMPLQPLGNREQFYLDHIEGCIDHYGEKGDLCLETEIDRVNMNLRQPQSMQNYTDIGFKKIRAPKEMMDLLSEFWKKNLNKATNEDWDAGNTYTNHWSSPSDVVLVDDGELRGGGKKLKNAIWDAARDTLQDWTGQELTPCSLYGIRVYKEGAILATHVDRLPLVSSAIINVAQDVDEPWPIEVYGHDGKAVNVTMEPGDMVLYESHSVLHGRPFPLKGRYYANVFIHFEPVGHSKRHEEKEKTTKDTTNPHLEDSSDSEDSEDGEEENLELPSYIIKGSPEEAMWREEHQGGESSESEDEDNEPDFKTGSTAAHRAVQEKDLETLKELLENEGSHLMHAKDENGFTPLHEAVLRGNTEIAMFLVNNGADVNERTNYGRGGNALWWVVEEHGEDHPLVEFLEENEAEYIEPEL